MSGNTLPPALAADPTMAALADIADRRFNALAIDKVMVMLFDLVDASALPSLGEQFGLIGEGWELAESEDARRALLKRAIDIKRHKGTPWAVREVFRALGFGEVNLIEGLGDFVLDGSVLLDGTYVLGDPTAWASYSVEMAQPITNDQAERVRAMLKQIAPARCHLEDLIFTEALFRLDGTVLLDGTYNLGVA